jgi:SAM-dependent methyltransferase
MPTTPSEPASNPEPEPRALHQVRQAAESFGSDAERYDRTRPRYPDALIDRIVAGSPGRDVLDVGCGTGIVARQFQAAGCRVLGVDPDERMVEFARQHGLEAEVAKFEDWDASGRDFDAVVAGMTWHWVDQAAGAAKAATVLRPGGRLALFWNASEPPPDLGRAFADVHRRVLPSDSPLGRGAAPGLDRYADAMCGNAADGMQQAGAFADTERWRFDWDRSYTRDEWLELVPTFGGIGGWLPPETLRELLAGIGAVIDAAGGRFTVRYAAVAVTATRTAPGPS